MVGACTLLLAAIVVLPSDRLAMADRQFNRGDYAVARTEYLSLRGESSLSAEDVLYRIAECERALGNKAEARKAYAELIAANPTGPRADRARLERALAGTDADRRTELKVLDSDRVEPSIRACALYHLGVLNSDADALARSVKADPKGQYARYARFRRASLLLESAKPEERRTGVGELLEIAFSGTDELAHDALYLAGAKSYAEKRYGEAVSLFSRYLKTYDRGRYREQVRTMCAWSQFLAGKYADATATCGEGGTDDFAYLLAASANASCDSVRAKGLFGAYLENYPQGRYRESAELALSRIRFAEAEGRNDAAGLLENAKRTAAITKSAADRLRLAWAYERAGKDAEALEGYSAVARDFPATDEAAEALFRKAMVDIRAKRWSPAELALAEALKSGKNEKRRAESLYWRGIAASRLGHAAEGCGYLDEALKGGLAIDQAREARLMLADRDYADGKTAEAKAAYAKLVREGATDRMGAAKTLAVGKFLLGSATPSNTSDLSTVDAAKLCAKSLADRGGTPEWRQAAFALQGACEERLGEYSAALASYRKMKEMPVRTEDAAPAMVRLGVLEAKAGDNKAAIETLKEAVALNARDAKARVEAYLGLARACEATGDVSAAVGYATVIANLFDDAAAVAEAQRVIKAHPEAAK